MIFIVLGMLKSGATLVASLLHNSGSNVGEFDEGISYDQGNPFERAKVQEISQNIIGVGVSNLRSLDAIEPKHITDWTVTK